MLHWLEAAIAQLRWKFPLWQSSAALALGGLAIRLEFDSLWRWVIDYSLRKQNLSMRIADKVYAKIVPLPEVAAVLPWLDASLDGLQERIQGELNKKDG